MVRTILLIYKKNRLKKTKRLTTNTLKMVGHLKEQMLIRVNQLS